MRGRELGEDRGQAGREHRNAFDGGSSISTVLATLARNTTMSDAEARQMVVDELDRPPAADRPGRARPRILAGMSNPPAINFVIPFAPIAFRVVVNANGVQPDGTNVPVPDTTSSLVIGSITGPTGFSAAIDQSDNRRVIVTPGLLAPGSAAVPWSFRVSVAGKVAFVSVSGTTPALADASGVSWDGVAPAPAA